MSRLNQSPKRVTNSKRETHTQTGRAASGKRKSKSWLSKNLAVPTFRWAEIFSAVSLGRLCGCVVKIAGPCLRLFVPSRFERVVFYPPTTNGEVGSGSLEGKKGETIRGEEGKILGGEGGKRSYGERAKGEKKLRGE